MKLKLCFLAMLCSFLQAGGQDKDLKVGEVVPDVLIKNISGLSVSGRPVVAARLSDFKGKLLVLDFWATWCAPCRAMLPVEDSLQRVFGKQVVFLPVSYQSAGELGPVLAELRKRHVLELPQVSSDTVLHRLFPHRSLPHYVWIGPDGRFLATSGDEAMTAAAVRLALSGVPPVGLMKRDTVIAFDKSKPLLVDGNGGSSAPLVYHSLLGRYLPGVPAGMDITAEPGGGARFTLRNVPLLWFLRLAFSDHNRWFSDARIVLETRDSAVIYTHLPGAEAQRWVEANSWCYELKVPASLKDAAYTLMQEDLRRLFPAYRVTTETRRVRCLALVRTGNADRLRSRGGASSVSADAFHFELRNVQLAHLVARLDWQYLSTYPLPIVNATDYHEPVDLTVHAEMTNVGELNRALAAYGLRFEERVLPVELLVVRDNQPDTQTTAP